MDHVSLILPAASEFIIARSKLDRKRSASEFP